MTLDGFISVPPGSHPTKCDTGNSMVIPAHKRDPLRKKDQGARTKGHAEMNRHTSFTPAREMAAGVQEV